MLGSRSDSGVEFGRLTRRTKYLGEGRKAMLLREGIGRQPGAGDMLARAGRIQAVGPELLGRCVLFAWVGRTSEWWGVEQVRIEGLWVS